MDTAHSDADIDIDNVVQPPDAVEAEILLRGVSSTSRLNLSARNLSGLNLAGVNLSKADLSKVDLSRADLRDADLRGANLREADLREADLRGADLHEANLSQADLRGARISGLDLSGMDLSGADLREIDFTGVNLRGANLSEAVLCEAILNKTILNPGLLRRADLSRADLSHADLRGTNLSRADLSEANLQGADLRGADLRRANLSQANLKEANLSGSLIYAISAWDVQLENTIQLGLIIADSGQATVTVDNLEVAQFINLLLTNKKIRDVIDTVTSKVVLILGRFTPKRKVILEAIRDKLRKNYIPVVFDFEKPTNRDVTETVSTLAHIARFIIADITDAKSTPQELMAIVPHLPSVPVQPLLQASEREYGMFERFPKYPWVLPIYRYSDLTNLLESLDESVIKPAEEKVKELVQR
jgi:uncharacterized protein YjbI with pentapeptide repeats